MPTGNAWRLIRSGPLPGALNMAVDEVLLEEVAAGRSRPVLRLYRWSPPAVSLGYGQRDPAAVDRAACRALGIDVVRRPTGGRAVLHDRELTYAVIAPERYGPFPGGITANSRVITDVLAATLAGFGIEARPAATRRTRFVPSSVASVCFAAPVTAELVCRGRKLAGGAQKRQGSAFLQHGSLPLDLDLELLGRLLGPADGAGDCLERLAETVGWVNRFAPRRLEIGDLETGFTDRFADRLALALEEESLRPAEMARARALAASRYADPDWSRRGFEG